MKHYIKIFLSFCLLLALATGCAKNFVLKKQSVNFKTCPISETTLDIVVEKRESIVGTAYEAPDNTSLEVIDVIPGKGVIAREPKTRKFVMILTKANYRKDATWALNNAPLKPSIYVCVGTAEFRTQDGFERVDAYEEMVGSVFELRMKELKEKRIARMKEEEEERIRKEKAAIEEEARRKKAELEAKIEREKREAELKREQEAKERELQKQKAEEEKKLEEERKARYPQEQKERKEYAEVLFAKLDFEIRHYVALSKTAASKLAFCYVKGDLWNNLRDAHREQDWLKLMSLISGSEQKDYPDQDTMKELLNKLLNTSFVLCHSAPTVKIFMKKEEKGHMLADPFECSERIEAEYYMSKHPNFKGEFHAHLFKMNDGKPVFYFTEASLAEVNDPPSDRLFEKLSEIYRKKMVELNYNLENKKIDEETFEKERDETFEQFRSAVYNRTSSMRTTVKTNQEEEPPTSTMTEQNIRRPAPRRSSRANELRLGAPARKLTLSPN